MSADFYLMVFLGFVMLGCFYYVMSDLAKICKMLKDLTKSHHETRPPRVDVASVDEMTCGVKNDI